MTTVANRPRLRWRKSSRSDLTDQCVEICIFARAAVLMRDSKDRQRGPLAFAPSSWDDFLHGVRLGEFDRQQGLI
ncbi:DUF397 domain-containing protein [Phytohabitans sp. LJ34]|uniref:DUF397 domain-containing protein n=1 Tax=Phytohabitans sp. LJ34 TaxID=3452217 RepID=UPI003F8A0623